MSLEFYLKAEGPMEQAIMSLVDELRSVLSNTENLTSEAAQIRTAVEEFKTANASLTATVNDLRAQLANGSSVTDEQLRELLALAKAKDAAILGIFTPDFHGKEPAPEPTEPPAQ